VDVQAINVYGKEDSISTVQVDFNLPERFDLEYTDEDGKKKRPFVIHRALIGSFERFFAFLIEYYAGKFPLWFAPEQIVIIPVSDKFNDYANKVNKGLKDAGNEYNIWIRSSVDDRNETLQARIRDAELRKVPYVLIIGGREEENESVSVRVRGQGDKGAVKLSEFKQKMLDEIKTKALELWK
jgi:threonyl-tRNA synthetase